MAAMRIPTPVELPPLAAGRGSIFRARGITPWLSGCLPIPQSRSNRWPIRPSSTPTCSSTTTRSASRAPSAPSRLAPRRIARCTRGAASLCSHGYTDSNSTRIDASDEDDGEEKTAGLLLHYDLRGTLPRPGQPTQMGRQLQWFIRLELTPPTINPGRQTLGPRTAEQHLLGCLTLPSLPRLVALIALIRVLTLA
jgi:hypothetical protein